MQSLTPAALKDRYWPLFPGVLLALVVAAAARFVADHYAAPVMLFALLIGMAFNFLAVDQRFKPGLEFSSKSLLRFGIVLLGARITTSDIASLGISTFATVIGLIALTIATGFVCGVLPSLAWLAFMAWALTTSPLPRR